MFSAAIVLSLGVGIAASVALFSIVDAVLLRSLPVHEPGRLVSLRLGGWGDNSSYRAYAALRDGSGDVLEGLAAYATRPLTLSGGAAPERVEGAFVSGNFFSTMGVVPALGRPLTIHDERAGANGGVVVSAAFWSSHLGGEPAALGRMLRINGRTFPIVGVAPHGFFGVDVGRRIDCYLPLTAAAEIGAVDPGMLTGDFSTWLRLFGRLRPGVEERHAAAGLTTVLRVVMSDAISGLERMTGTSPERRRRLLAWEVSVDPAGRGHAPLLRRRLSTPLSAAAALVALLLVLVTVNVACLLLSRAVSRRRELTIRLSLGASRGRVVRQLLTESSLLVGAGACLALLLAPALIGLVVRFLPGDLGPVSLPVSVDWRVLGVTGLLAGLMTVPVSLAAGIYVVRATRSAGVRTTSGSTDRVRTGAQRGLVVAQVALSVIVLVTAALFVRTLGNLQRVDMGQQPGQVLIGFIDPSAVGYSGERLHQLYRTIQDRLAALPDASSASVMIGQPFLLRRGGDVEVEGQRVNLRWESVAPDFLRTVGTTLKAGREFGPHDDGSGPLVAMVNETLARQHFGQANPIGRHIVRFGTQDGRPVRRAMEIVGVVADSIHRSPRDAPRPVMYVPAAQEDFALSPATVLVRSSHPTASRLIESVRRSISEIDADLAVFGTRTLAQQIDETIWAERLLARVAGAFGVTALLLAGLGLFGTLSQGVTRRAREIGIRVAIGADPRAIQRSVVREALWLCAAGALCGAPLAVAAARSLASVLYGVQPADFVALASAVALLAIMGAAAAYVPSRRASRVNPVRVLRAD